MGEAICNCEPRPPPRDGEGPGHVNITSHKAENMCNSETSWGPDFVSPDGMFCDMGTKTLSPLYSNQNVQGCVDIDEGENIVRKRPFVAKRQVDSTHRKYEEVTKW